MSASALQRLAAVAPRDLVRVTQSGRRLFHELLLQCRAAGLTAGPNSEHDVAHLHALFDVALQYGLGSLVYDYVVEVCSDKYCTSSDALEAYLLDGECVKKWCHAALEREHSHILQGLTRGLASLASQGELYRHVGRLTSLVSILEALGEPAEPISHAQPHPSRELVLAQQLHQCAQVLEWVAQHVAHAGGSPGRYASDQEWRSAVNKRRNAVQPATPFLQDLLQELASQHGIFHWEQGVTALQYPPTSLEKAIQGIFLNGGTDQASWHRNLALLLYYLMDAGLSPDPKDFMQGFSIGTRQVVEWQAYFYLDDALLGNTASLEEACRTLPAAATPATRLKVVEALAARGCADVALDVLHVRSAAGSRRPGGAPAEPLGEAQVALAIRLDCNLVTEAFMEAREHCERTGPDQRPSHTRALIHMLASWAAKNKAMIDVLKLPFNILEEQMLTEWLESEMEAGRTVARFLPLYFLLRSRIPEALHAHARLVRSSVPGGDDSAAALAQLLASAARLLPRAQKALCVLPDQDGPGLQLAAGSGSVSDEQRSAALPIVTGLADLEMWAASHAALLARGKVLSGPVRATDAPSTSAPEPGDMQVAQEAAVEPASRSEDGGLGAGLRARQVPSAESRRGDWASWKSGQATGQGEARVSFGQLPEEAQGEAQTGGEEDWQQILGVPAKRGTAPASKRARVAASGRSRQPKR
ncbi:E3 ubiquitin-protein ligase HOS1 [Coccomyxa sp. Obi]|nr:E3 ubiquitin-protein ligase HOS1 [Coccomyxa sp. Obi]